MTEYSNSYQSLKKKLLSFIQQTRLKRIESKIAREDASKTQNTSKAQNTSNTQYTSYTQNTSKSQILL